MTNPPGHDHPTHSMVLDCILVDVSINSTGQQILSNHAFRFKNTNRNQKQIEIPLSMIDFRFFSFPISLLDSPRSPLEFYYIFIDFVPEVKCDICNFTTNEGGYELENHIRIRH